MGRFHLIPKPFHPSSPAMTGRVLLGVLLLLLTTCGDPAQETAPLLAHAEWAASANSWTPTVSMQKARESGTATLLPDGRVLVAGGHNEKTAELYDPNTRTWSYTQSMTTVREAHTATLLPNGKVLVTGGENVSTRALSSAELYDPTTGAWSSVASMGMGRSHHTATLLPDGKVLVTGGMNPASLNTVELYDPTTNTWAARATMAVPRFDHTATLLPNGRVLVMGGVNTLEPIGSPQYQAKVEEYDPAPNKWSGAVDMKLRRSLHTATLLPSGWVLVTGGEGDPINSPMTAELYAPGIGSVDILSTRSTNHRAHTATLLPSGKVLIVGEASSELYDPALNRFDTLVALSSIRRIHTATLLPNGQVLVAGSGDKAGMLYEPAVATWTPTPTMGSARHLATTTLLASGHVLVTGGDSGGGTALGSTAVYDSTGSKWYASAALLTARWSHTATSLPAGQVLVTGGKNATGALAAAELLTPDPADPTKGTWSSAGTMGSARSGHTSTLLPTGQVLVVGGENAGGVLSSAELFTRVASPDPRLTPFNPWASIPSLSTPRRYHTATALPSGQVLVVGGDNAGGILSSAELYEPATGSWTSTTGMSAARRNHTAVLLTNGKVLVMGGDNTSGALASAELYDPQARTWTSATALGTARKGHVALLLPTGQVMVIAGLGSAGSVLSSVELYEPATGTWTDAGTLASPRKSHAAALLPSGRVLVVGGMDASKVLDTAEVYSDDDAGALEDWRPSVTTPSSMTQLQSFTVTGSRFMGISDGNDGHTRSSDFHGPLARLTGLGGGGRYPLVLDRFARDTLTSQTVRLPPGPYLLSVTANAITGGRVVQVREAAPVPTIQCADPFVLRTSDLTGTAEPNSQVRIFIDGAPAGTALADNLGKWTFHVPTALGLSGGYHGFSAWSTEPPSSVSGSPRVSPLSDPFPCNVDSTPIDTTLLDPKPAARTQQTSASFTFSSEPGATFQCRLDSAAFSACVSPALYNGLTDGLHTFSVRAVDAFGNFDPTPASWSWTVDTVAPDTSFVSKPDTLTNQTHANFLSGSTETGSTFECSLDGSPFASCPNPATYTSLADGPHIFAVRAIDPAGNTDSTPSSWSWTVDTSGPDTTLTVRPAALSRQDSATLEFIASEPGTTFQCQLDTDSYFPCTSPKSYSGLTDGTHTVSVRAVDAAGNADSTPATATWRVDILAPDTLLDGKPRALTNEVNASFLLSSTEADVVYECKLDTGAFLPCVNPATYDNLAEGPHSFSARAVDPAGNVDATPVSWLWEVDTQAPDTALNTRSANGNSATFAFTSPEARTTFECSLDSGAFTVCTSPITYESLVDGTHIFAVRAVDGAGNRDPVPETYSWKVDISAPDTELTTRPAPDTQSTSATFTFTSPDPSATFECSLDNAAFAACTSPAFYTGLADGPHLFAVRAVDPALLVDPSPAFHSWNVDTQVPDTTLDLHPPALTNQPRALFDFSASEPGTTFQCSLDGATFAACPTPPAYELTTDGTHTFAVRAVDAAGNSDSSPASYSWTLDTATPDTTLVASSTDTANASFTFSSPEPGATFQCKLDSSVYAPCTSPATYTSLAETPHVFEVRAVDAAGNIDSTPARHEWAVNTAKPDTLIDYKSPTPVTKSTFATFVFSASKPGCTFQCSLDNEAFASCASPASYPDLTDGPHTFLVFAIDSGGRMDPTPTSYTWTVDTTNPDTTLNLRPPELTNQKEVRFAFTTSEPGSTFECSLDSAPYAVCTTPITYTGLYDGPHTFAVRAVDAAGNIDPTPSTWSWSLDTEAPETLLISKPKDLTNQANASFTFSTSETGVRYECSLLDGWITGFPDEASYLPCTSPAAYSLADGKHSFFVRAVDPAGNIDPSPARHEWTVDTTAPNTTLTFQELKADPTDPARVTGIQFTFETLEAGSLYQCRLDTAPFETCTSPVVYTYSTLADTSHSFAVRAVDAASNIDPTPATHSWTVPSTPLDTSIDYKSPTPVTRITFATFVFSANKLGSTFQCSLDNAAFTVCTSPISFSDLVDGPHTFLVFAIDAGGRVDPVPASYDWTVDTTNPDTTLNLRPPELTNQNPVQFTFASSEPGSTFECSLDGTSFVPCATPITYASLADGTHAFAVRAVDTAGNTDSTPAPWSFTVDTSAPLTTLIAKPSNPTGTPFVTFTFSSEPDVGFQCKMDEADYAACTSPASYTLADGDHRFFVRAVDAAGNIGLASPLAGYQFSITPAPLAPTVKQPADKLVLATGQPTISGEAAPNTTVSVLIDKTLLNTARVEATGLWSIIPDSPLQDGPHTLTATATDGNNRTSPSSTPISFTVDTTPPETTIDSGPEGKATSSEASFTFSSTEPRGTFECGLDDAEPTPCTSPLAFKGLSAGSHHLKVAARDAVGNKDPSPAEHTWTVPKPLDLEGGGGCGCTSPGSPPALALAGLLGLALGRRRRRPRNYR